MKSPTAKQVKQKISRSGNSEFTRAKLQHQYNPTVRFFKHNLMSINQIQEKDRHQYVARQQVQICDRALSEVRKGVRITLDWSTRTNFRTTKSLLPKVKTEPIQPLSEKLNELPQNNLDKNIQKRSKQLSRLLFKKHRKLYMLSKRERQQQRQLFGDNLRVFKNSKTQEHSFSIEPNQNSSNHSKLLKQSRTQTVQEVQDRILNSSNLKILKEELKNKFHQIRQSFHSKKQRPRHPLAKFLSP